jgi:uncharacterized damage-inducible protein DinB
MQFEIQEAETLLRRTPASITALLEGLSETWLAANEGADSWNPNDVVAHLVYCDRHNWLPRVKHILETGTGKAFSPLDRQGGMALRQTHTAPQLLELFRQTRRDSLLELQQLSIDSRLYGATGLHPDFGTVSLGQLLATWVVHDLSHLAQTARILAHQYRANVGPWSVYLRILH